MARASPSAVFKSSGQTFTDGVLIEKGSGEDEEEEVEGEEEEDDFWPAPPPSWFLWRGIFGFFGALFGFFCRFFCDSAACKIRAHVQHQRTIETIF